MKSITATETLTVGSGIVGLSAEQAKTRLHNLKLVHENKKGRSEYEVVAPIQFKRGESFEYSGEMGKDGSLRDAEAEALAKLETEDRIRAEVRAEERAKHAAALKAALAEQEGRLRAELAAGAKPQR